ncbi:histidine kinase [Cyanobacterium stanieri PCC 7202]|uniref:Circadian input-output histidine kinase CikA n=1 Tax=Cyanobacterium stanieri (strain ATCC 29140 / PCC 7202) TaxID=292563 RepID=K9YPY8_CYASC|nr:histidine kinase [Cyanobacterium stanieri PCC 7202]
MRTQHIDHIQIQEYLFSALENDKADEFYHYVHNLIADKYYLKTFIITQSSKQGHHCHHELVYSGSFCYDKHTCREVINQFNHCPKLDYYFANPNLEAPYKELSLSQLIFFSQNHIDKIHIFPIIYKREIIGNLWLEISPHELEKFKDDQIVKIVLQSLALLFVQIDITQQKEEVIKAKENQSQYFSKVNHEIRTPIASVIGFSKVLKEQLYGELNPKQLQYVNAIYDSGNYLLDLVVDLLDIAKLEAKKQDLYLEKVFIKNLCQSCLSFVYIKTFNRDLKLNLIIEDDIKYICADERKIKQILINLLSNAVKFTEKGSVTLKVSVESNWIKFSVIDTGIGIKEEDYHKLFQPFSQIKTPLHDKEKGTGLGLVISQELARLHGGDITFESAIGKGSIFTLTLPTN